MNAKCQEFGCVCIPTFSASRLLMNWNDGHSFQPNSFNTLFDFVCVCVLCSCCLPWMCIWLGLSFCSRTAGVPGCHELLSDWVDSFFKRTRPASIFFCFSLFSCWWDNWILCLFFIPAKLVTIGQYIPQQLIVDSSIYTWAKVVLL